MSCVKNVHKGVRDRWKRLSLFYTDKVHLFIQNFHTDFVQNVISLCQRSL